MNRPLLIRVILWHLAFISLGAIGAGVFFGMNATLSCVAGGLCVFVPNAFFALCWIALQTGGASANPSVLLIFEFIKLAIVCLLLSGFELARNAFRNCCGCIEQLGFTDWKTARLRN